MMVVPIDGPTSVLCNKKIVITSTLVPQSTLGKKNSGIFCHAVRDAVAAQIHWIAHIDGRVNPEGVLTNLLTS